MPDLFGEPRFRHPDTLCVAERVIAAGVPLTVRIRCVICENYFTTRHNTGYRRATCSDQCKRDVQLRNAERATRARLERQKKSRKTSNVRQLNGRTKRYWQAKAELQDQYFAAKRNAA
jgi:hypothetical protein